MPKDTPSHDTSENSSNGLAADSTHREEGAVEPNTASALVEEGASLKLTAKVQPKPTKEKDQDNLIEQIIELLKQFLKQCGFFLEVEDDIQIHRRSHPVKQAWRSLTTPLVIKVFHYERSEALMDLTFQEKHTKYTYQVQIDQAGNIKSFSMPANLVNCSELTADNQEQMKKIAKMVNQMDGVKFYGSCARTFFEEMIKNQVSPQCFAHCTIHEENKQFTVDAQGQLLEQVRSASDYTPSQNANDHLEPTSVAIPSAPPAPSPLHSAPRPKISPGANVQNDNDDNHDYDGNHSEMSNYHPQDEWNNRPPLPRGRGGS